MKKIVALVLCLVLALSLCTVAFAASCTLSDEDGNEVEKVSYKFHEAKAPDFDAKNPKGNVAYYEITDDAAWGISVGSVNVKKGDKFVQVKWDEAVLYLTIGTKTIGIARADVVEYDYAATEYTKVDSDKCDYINDDVDTDNVYLQWTNEDKEVEVALEQDTATAAYKTVLYNGEITYVGDPDAVNYVAHEWTENDEDDDGVAEAGETATCDWCDITGKLYTGLTPVGYTDGGFLTGNDGLKVAIKNGTVAGGSSTTVESAKTFDAGIAMYAGLALASVAGSAVVIGKKKEF